MKSCEMKLRKLYRNGAKKVVAYITEGIPHPMVTTGAKMEPVTPQDIESASKKFAQIIERARSVQKIKVTRRTHDILLSFVMNAHDDHFALHPSFNKMIADTGVRLTIDIESR
jgi:hypothetical protein